MDPPPYSLEYMLGEALNSLDDPLPEESNSPEDELPKVPYSLEDPLKEVSILVNNLHVLSDAFCRQLRCQTSSSEDERHIIRECLTAFSSLENTLVASVPAYYLKKPLYDSLRDLVGCIVSFSDFKQLEDVWEVRKAKLVKRHADGHDTYSRFATRLKELAKSKDEIKKRLHLAKPMQPLEPGRRLRMLYDDELYSFIHELEMTGILSTEDYIFRHIYPHECEMVTSKSHKLLLKRKWYAHSDPHQVVTHFSGDKNTIQDCLSSLQEQFEGNNDGGSRFLSGPKRDTSFDDLGKTLREFSEANTNTTYMILDGLDKYGSEDLTNLLELISTTINLSPKIHWIVSIRSFENSKAIKGIGYTLANVGDNEKLKDAAKKLVSMQVDTFFNRTGLRDRSRNHFSRNDLENILMKRSKGNLLWITLACSIIEKDPMKAIYLACNLEEEIEGLYVHFNQQLQLQLLLTAEENDHLGEIVTILAAAYRPLTISELRLLVQLSDDVILKTLIKRRFLFLLGVQDDIVCFSHDSAKEYLYVPLGSFPVRLPALEINLSRHRHTENLLAKRLFICSLEEKWPGIEEFAARAVRIARLGKAGG
ncbi:uncharacterized protein Triagg1_1718 [Trichoderma aggressivum f. europaeum]|uniref:NACHT domain-containing protein n=1 Tax=Trichoderma aggressivum f. europaeum TaxID=173218 RepID=A0AAE1M2M5_9HYPO|nr:hypothetical protein Triagg1_1718 [Trichoderma aggressivum f. europaeum]